MSEQNQYEQEEAVRAFMRNLYDEDLREILSLPAGQRVLFHWLETAGTFGFLPCDTELEAVRAASLANYGRSRLQEIQWADTEGFINIMKAGLSGLAASGTVKEKEHER